MGSVCVIDHQGDPALPRWLVIDGQQRLTTISLLLSALSKIIKSSGKTTNVNADGLVVNYLVNQFESGDRKYKLLLNQKDRETYIHLLEGVDPPPQPSQSLINNYRYFEEQITKIDTNFEHLYQGICKLQIVQILLNSETDDPQLIFESLNSTGLDLSQADMIRNFVLMRLTPSEQESVYHFYWYPMEKSFDQASSELFDHFIRDYLTLKSKGKIPVQREVFTTFKAYTRSQTTASMQEVVVDVYHYSKDFCKLFFAQESDPDINQALLDIRTLKVNVAYPF